MKKIGLLVLALVLALGALGVGYASWTDTVIITETVETGEVCWQFVPTATSLDDCPNGLTSGDFYAGSLDYTIGPNPGSGAPMDPNTIHRVDKNVGCTTVEITNPKLVTVVLSNTYPCYYNEITVHQQNCGTIPIKLYDAVFSYVDTFTGLTVTIPLDSLGKYLTIWGLDKDGGHSEVIEVKWKNNIGGTQVEPLGEAEDSFGIHVLQPAKQGYQYSFTITRTVIQWNEY